MLIAVAGKDVLKLFRNLKQFKIRENPKIKNTIKILKALKSFKEFDSVKNLRISKAFGKLKDKMSVAGPVIPQILLLSVPHVLVMFLVISAVIPPDTTEGRTVYDEALYEDNAAEGALAKGGAEYKTKEAESADVSEEQTDVRAGNRIRRTLRSFRSNSGRNSEREDEIFQHHGQNGGRVPPDQRFGSRALHLRAHRLQLRPYRKFPRLPV